MGDVLREMFATPQARDYRTGQASRWEANAGAAKNLEAGGDIETGEKERKAGEQRSVKSVLGGMADGFHDWMDRDFLINHYWDIEPDIPRIATGVKYRVDRLKGLGNVAVPQQFYPIFKAIVNVEAELRSLCI